MREPIPRRQWIMAVAGVVLIAVAGWILLHRRAPAHSMQPVRAAGERAVALYVQHDGPALRLRWNPDTAPIRDASGGVLSIVDGARESRLELKSQDLRAGVASYWPESREVTFRLTLDGDAAGEIRASANAPPEARPSPFDSRREPVKETAAGRTAARSSTDAESGEDDPPPPSMVTYFTVPAAPVAAHAVKPSAPAPKAEDAAPPTRAVARAPKAPAAASAERQVEEEPEATKESQSRWRRVTGKIPLLRRLGKH